METAEDTSVVIKEKQVSSPDLSSEMEALKTRIKELEDVIASKDAHIKELNKTILQVTIDTILFRFFNIVEAIYSLSVLPLYNEIRARMRKPLTLRLSLILFMRHLITYIKLG